MLEVKQLSCTRDNDELFKHFSLSLIAGDILHLKGPNGSGKTSFFRILTGLACASAGKIYWKNEEVSKNKANFLQQVLYIGHQLGITLQLTAAENLKALSGLYGVYSNAQIQSALKAVGLASYEDTLCFRLSAGQKQKVVQAQLFLTSKPLWLLDEPFNAIDQQSVCILENKMISHAKSGGIILLTTHHNLQPNYPQFSTINLVNYQAELMT